MKKISGKALSLVLSLALVVSSFSVSLASAATTSETATSFSLSNPTVYLANGGSTTAGLTADVVGNFAIDANGASLYDHKDVTNALALKEVVLTGGSGIASIQTSVDANNTVNHVYVTLANANVTGTVTLAGRYTGPTSRNTTDTINVYATATVTVKVLQNGSAIIGKSGAVTDGSYPTALDAFPKDSAGDTTIGQQAAAVYEVAPKTPGATTLGDGALATYTAKAVSDTATADTYKVTSSAPASVALTFASSSFTVEEQTVSTEPYVRVGNYALQAVKYDATPNPTSTIANAVVTVANKVVASATDKVIYQYRGGTYIGVAPIADAVTTNTDKNVTGADIDISKTTGVTMQGGNIGTVSGAKTFSLQDGSVYAVADSVTGFSQAKGTVGNIGTDGLNGNVTINGGKAGNIVVGTTKTVTVQALDTKTPVTVGNISGASSVTIDSNDKAAVTAGTIKAAASSSITLKGSAVTVGQINDDYRSATLNLTDFTGSIATPINTADGAGSSVLTLASSGSTNAVVTGAAYIPTLNISGGTVYFADSVKTGTVYGAGTLKFNAGKLYATGNISGVSLRLANSFKVGDTVFQADAYKVYEGSFTPVGFTLEKVAGTTVDTFKVASVVFAGLNITGPTADQTIAVNATQTYTADTYPTGTSLPTGDTIQWSFDGNSDYFTFASTGNKATLTAKKIDTTFPSLNVGTLTASVVDQYGFKVYGYADATYKVTIATKSFTSDTTGDVKMNVGGTYQFKITSLDGTVPPFGLGGNGAAVTSTKVSGKDYFYKVTANKAGDYGVYVNGTRVAILRITAASAKIDTTVVTIKVGNTYQFKVTSAAKPAFGLGSSALQTVATSSKGKDYFYKVKAVSGKTGDKVGVYVNGTRAAIATIG